MRFGERLQVSIDVDADARDALVPSLILQPLIENAIKHAVAKRESGGSLEVEARHRGAHLVIVLRDDGPGGNEVAEMKTGRGVGLANTRERLRVLYGERSGIPHRQPHAAWLRGVRPPAVRTRAGHRNREGARMKIRTLIVDDEPLAQRGLELRLARHADVEIVGAGRQRPRSVPRDFARCGRT